MAGNALNSKTLIRSRDVTRDETTSFPRRKRKKETMQSPNEKENGGSASARAVRTHTVCDTRTMLRYAHAREAVFVSEDCRLNSPAGWLTFLWWDEKEGQLTVTMVGGEEINGVRARCSSKLVSKRRGEGLGCRREEKAESAGPALLS